MDPVCKFRPTLPRPLVTKSILLSVLKFSCAVALVRFHSPVQAQAVYPEHLLQNSGDNVENLQEEFLNHHFTSLRSVGNGCDT